MTKRSRSIAALALGTALLGGCASARVPAAGNGLTPYPLPRDLQAGDIVHLPTGTLMDFDQAVEMIAGARVIYIGEMHTNFQAHEVQRRIIEELERRFPGKVAIGMEMFREPQQPVLDRWTAGELSELQFLKESKWYEGWGADFENYRGILNLARDRKLDVLALNPAKDVQKQFAMGGSEPMGPGMADKVPETDFSDPFQRAMLQAIFAGHAVRAGTPVPAPASESDDPLTQAMARAPAMAMARARDDEAAARMFDSFYRTQILWEESMASKLVDYLGSPAGEGKKMVVIAGGYHVRHGIGVPRKALRRAAWPYVIVLPIELSIPEELRAELTMDVDTPEIPLPLGDFAWMVPYEDIKADKVRLGVMMRVEEETVIVEKVLPGSPAEEAGIKAGDVFVSLDDFPVREMGDVILVIGQKKPGDTLKTVLRRDSAELTMTPVLTVPPKP